MRRNFRISLLIGAALVALALSGCGALSAGGLSGAEQVDTITVSGFGTATGEPNIATIQLGVNVIDSDIAEAVRGSNEVIADITEALTGMGIEAKDIQTTNFNVWPEDRFSPETGQPTGERVFHVESTVQVKVRQIDQTSQVIEAALDSGANNIFGLSFGIEDLSELEQSARQDAISDAQDRAEQLAAAIGVTLGEPVLVSEGSGPIVPGPFMNFAVVEQAVGVGGGPPISSGELTASVSVTVVYRITR